jgi:uncharacterized membrane protein
VPTIHVTAECAAPVEQVFDYIADYRTTPDWFYGVKSWEPVTEETRGVGARFEAAVSLGLTIRSTVELQEYVENELMVINAVEGFPNRSRWRFSPSATGGPGTTTVQCEFSYEFPGGIAGKAMAKVVEPVVKIAVAHATKEFTHRAVGHVPGT